MIHQKPRDVAAVGIYHAKIKPTRQVSVTVSTVDWLLLREEAARRRISVAELLRRWIDPRILALRQQSG